MTILHPCCQLLPIVPDHYKNLAAIQQNRTEIDLAENKEGFFLPVSLQAKTILQSSSPLSCARS